MATMLTVPARVDLRSQSAAELLDRVVSRVEAAMQVQLDRTSLVRKRRSIGGRTERGTWVRVEARPWARLFGQGNGVEAAAALAGVARPAWFAGVAWDDPERQVQWRADETALVSAAPVKPGGTLTLAPELDDRWWARLTTSLAALQGASTTRVATVHTELMTQERITATIRGVFGDRVDTTVTQWAPAHADLNWANLTAPQCWILDWEDWGLAPQGLDAAQLWLASLAVPALAQRVAREFPDDLASRSGMVAALFFCCGLIAAGPEHAGPLAQPVAREAARLLTALQ